MFTTLDYIKIIYSAFFLHVIVLIHLLQKCMRYNEKCTLLPHNLQLFVFRKIEKFKVRTTSLSIKAGFRRTPPTAHVCSFIDKNNVNNYMIHLFLKIN